MKLNEHGRFDAFELEQEARRMQARAMAEGMRSVGRWLRGVKRA